MTDLTSIMNVAPVLQIAACAENSINSTCHDKNPDLRISIHLPHSVIQFIQRFLVQGVDRRTFQCNDGYRSFPPQDC